MMPLIASPVHAEDETYTITFSPGSVGGESVTIRSTDAGRMAESGQSAEPGQFYREGDSIIYKLSGNEQNFTVPEGHYFFNWDCSGGEYNNNLFRPEVILRRNDVTMTALWTDWSSVSKEVIIDPGEIGGDPVTVKSTDEGRIAGNRDDAEIVEEARFYPELDPLGSCEHYYMPGTGRDYFTVPEGYRLLNWYCDGTDKYYETKDGVPIPGDSITLTAQWEYVEEEVIIDGIKYCLDSRNGGKATVSGFDGSSISENVTIPGSINHDGKEYTVTNIRRDAFKWCSLQSVTIPESVENIGSCAFQVCSNLQSVVIPKSVKSIGPRAFEDCGSLTTIYYTGTEEEWDKISKAEAQIPETAEIRHITVEMSPESMEYNGSVQKPEISVTLGGTALTEGADYTLEWSDENSTNAGTYTVAIKGSGDISSFKTVETYTITAKKITPAVTLSASGYIYNGKMRTPSVTVKAGSMKFVKDRDYTVTYASGRKNVGKYKVTVNMKGNYTGTKAATFKITPKKAGIYSAKAGKGKVKVTMSKKVSATGGKYYQIKYRLKGKSSWKTVKTTLKTKTIKSLKKGKRYQIKVRAFKKVSGITYYGAWSKIKLTDKIK